MGSLEVVVCVPRLLINRTFGYSLLWFTSKNLIDLLINKSSLF